MDCKPYQRADGSFMQLGENMWVFECEQQLSQTVAFQSSAGGVTIEGAPAEYLPQVGTAMGAVIVTYFFIKLINKIFA